jgi:hypothetical protein
LVQCPPLGSNHRKSRLHLPLTSIDFLWTAIALSSPFLWMFRV